MEDLIGVARVTGESALIAALVYFLRGMFSIWLLLLLLLLLIVAAMMFWHSEKAPTSVAGWRKAIVWSIVLGVLFFATDLGVGYLFGESGSLPLAAGPSGIILTVLVCPVFTMICVAGLGRAVLSQEA
jgi:hypothetical protein